VRRVPLLALLALVLSACGGGAASPEEAADAPADTAPSAPAPETDAAAAPDGGGASRSGGDAEKQRPAGLPGWTAGYRGWTKLNASPLPERDPDPHRGTKNVFASNAAAAGTFPAGTVVVKEGFRPGKDFVGLIAAMRKVPGRNPEHRDWVFVEWARESPDAPFTELARGDVCTSCHVGAADRDYVFTAG
jgi:hypothetical protein